jgi:uncharacterized protein YvpB
VDLTNKSIETLKQHLDNGKPVIVWMTLDLSAPKETDKRFDEKQPLNEIIWIWPEHCALLVGYDDTNYLVNDPHTGKTEYPYFTCGSFVQIFYCLYTL